LINQIGHQKYIPKSFDDFFLTNEIFHLKDYFILIMFLCMNLKKLYCVEVEQGNLADFRRESESRRAALKPISLQIIDEQ
jgi:hypothetical protein